MTFWHATALFTAALAAGAINAVAGGGTLVSFPALVWALGDSIAANATSTVALLPGSLSSAVAYRRDMEGAGRWLWYLGGPSLVGGLFGAWLLLETPSATFSRLVPYLVLGATGLRALSGPINRWLAHPKGGERSKGWWMGAMTFQLLVAIYGGYFGAGIGLLMLAAFGLLGLTDIHQMNGLKCLLTLGINGVAAACFILAGKVAWPEAAVMTVAAVLGGYAGAAASRKLGKKFANAAVLVIGFAAGFWLLARSH